MPEAKSLRSALPLIGLALALAAGIALRLAYPLDIEWKTDERAIFAHAQAMAAGGAWPAVGQPASMGPPHPGMSLWAFGVLAALIQARSPPDLARAVQLTNVVALLLLAAFAFMSVPKARREPWLWAAALWAVNPLAIIFERKIWNPSVLPLPMVGFIWAWWGRRHPAGAFAWGVLGAVMAQLHLGVIFLALAVALWTLIHDRAAFPWKGWLAGSLVGALPAVPWLLALTHHAAGAGAKAAAAGAGLMVRIPIASYFVRWVSQPFGFGVGFTLGRRQIADYLAGPVMGSLDTHVMAATQIVLAAACLIVLVQALRAIRLGDLGQLRSGVLGDSPETVLICAALWGYGGALTALTVIGADSNRHYMIVVGPLMALWAAMTVLVGDPTPGRRRARTLLSVICLCQAIASAGLLAYIDQTGVIAGDYGATWRVQQSGATPTHPR
jgi:hypothetical protein